jgi:riboflavin kinase / FMN adenylyltransferase
MSASFDQVSSLEAVTEQKPTYLAIGTFDGVHLGHQQLLQSMVAAARKAGARAAALTFFPHPLTVIRGKAGRFYLCTLEERVRLLGQQGLDLVVTHPFDEEVRQTRAADFVEGLCQYLGLRELWGGTFALGYNREGDMPFLQRLGQEKGFTVQPFPALVSWQDQPVSSSRVRQALRDGQMANVTGCLGRLFQVTGTVIQGDGRGKSIGVPTANLAVWDEHLLPANGVYAAVASLGGQLYGAATNVGYRPTVNGHDLNVEAHLLDFDGDIYGQELSLRFIRHIRPEQKFSGLDALVAQIQRDIVQVRQIVQPYLPVKNGS